MTKPYEIIRREKLAAKNKARGIKPWQREKMVKAIQERFKNFCHKGHKRTPENTKETLTKDGRVSRKCLDCVLLREKDGYLETPRVD